MLGGYQEKIISLLLIYTTIERLVSNSLGEFIGKLVNRLKNYLNPRVAICFNEFTTGLYKRSYVFTSIESYLSPKSASVGTKLRAESYKKGEPLVYSADYQEIIEDEFEGVKVTWWKGTDDGGSWNCAPLEHPATFDTFAMDSKRKEEIVTDLIGFSQGKEYYAKIGKPWKRGYLLYGPPGTGKSTMIAAMANLLGYDIYDLELSTVKNNGELKSLLISTSPKAIIVVEDIDCSAHLTRNRASIHEEYDDENKNENTKSKPTLSGFLNLVDGVWSACGGERIIVFTTNHIDKLDLDSERKNGCSS
ncbi:ATPase, AAA-type, core [Corchorus capsularis]|uniref:ATPase, AAA-type, core n=1 Tax=Corchorus capsularis TaxID=210143 RepID=A0A1R3JCU8_COCAP|nr:ATPase, AAA-type, core [Corchorus capsularis]